MLTGFIENTFAGKDRKKTFTLKWVFYRGLTVVRGWMNYYGKYCMHSMKGIMDDFNLMLPRWAKAKYKRFKRKPVYLALKWLGCIAKREPMFYHWKLGIYPKNVKCY
ncbi:hypothetical protein KCV26_15825 [Petrimonas sulfuriphila]